MPFPYYTESIQAAVLSSTSNVLAQAISAYREDKAFALDITPVVQFAIHASLNTPINCAWQEWLEARFPGSTSQDAEKPFTAGTDAYEANKAEDQERIQQRSKNSVNVKNTAIKFVLDQTIGAAYNTVAFVGGMSALRGSGWQEIDLALRNDSLPIYLAGIKLWPAVSLLNFTVVPVERRVLFGSLVGLVWGIFLSLQVSNK